LSSKLFVGNLEFSTTREQLDQLFSEAGTIVDLFLPSDRATGKPRGFAFVEFASEEQAQQAISKFDGQDFEGRPLRVNMAEDRPRRPFSPGGPPPPSSRPSFVGSFPDDRDDGGGGGGGGRGGGFGGRGRGNSKGSRRGLRARKRSL
jgi:cold-inducible RNA-binding protein